MSQGQKEKQIDWEERRPNVNKAALPRTQNDTSLSCSQRFWNFVYSNFIPLLAPFNSFVPSTDFFFFLLAALVAMQKFPGQGSNLCQNSDNAKSLAARPPGNSPSNILCYFFRVERLCFPLTFPSHHMLPRCREVPGAVTENRPDRKEVTAPQRAPLK